MNRCLKAFSLLAIITFFAACKKDDGNAPVPPRDYNEQYANEKVTIENYLKNHYMVVDEDYNVTFDSITNPATQVSIWDQTEYPLQQKTVRSILQNNTAEYKIYYITFRQGVGNAPTRADNVLISYRGTTFNGTQFDYAPFPQTAFSLASTIEGWQEIIPLFKSGTLVDIPDNPNPAEFTDYGAGVMFVPSGLGYYNSPTTALIGAYDSLIFSFKLFAVDYADSDADGILNKDEVGPDNPDVYYYDSDGDGTPNYMDIDDDGDGYPTKTEITDANGNIIPFENIPACSQGGTVKKHLDPACH